MSLKRPLSPSSSQGLPSSQEIHTSHLIHDRGSKFIALFSVSPTYKSNPKALQSHASLEGSMHRVLAWRKPSAQTSLDSRRVFETHSDEDGETYAGKHVEKVLAQAGVEGVCVVGRWFGGTLLGPVRFEHIENVAREAIDAWRATGEGGMVKKPRVEDARSKEELVVTLGERDESVKVLRGLLAEKQGILAGLKGGDEKEGEMKAKASPAKAVSYEGMSVAQLLGQEKARDATLTWILKQIDGVEKEIEAIADVPDEDGVEADEEDADTAAEVEADYGVEAKEKDKKAAKSELQEKSEPKAETEANDG